MKNGGKKQKCCVYNFGLCIYIYTCRCEIKIKEDKRKLLKTNNMVTYQNIVAYKFSKYLQIHICEKLYLSAICNYSGKLFIK